MPWKLAACGCLIALLTVACQSDSDSVTGVDRTLDHHERGNCHFAPAASITQDAGDELVTIEFTYGGGEIFAGPESDCDESSGPDIEGTLLASHGVSYGDTVGTHGTFLAIEQCETRMVTPCAYDLPSAPNAMWIDALFGYSGYLRFDPPISELSFQVCSTQQHAMAAWDSLGNLVVPDTIGPSGVDGPEGGCDAGWLPFKISTSGYDISRVRLRRFDPGYTFWDDMTFRRKSSCQPSLAFPGGPTADPILDDPAVQASLYEALEAGNAFDPDKNVRVEELGWIFERPDGSVYVKRIPPLEQTACSNDPSSGAVPDDPADVPIAGFHTHPFSHLDVLPTSCPDKAGQKYDAQTHGGPSRADWEGIIKDVQNFNIPYYVVDLDHVYAAESYTDDHSQRAAIPEYDWVEKPNCQA